MSSLESHSTISCFKLLVIWLAFEFLLLVYTFKFRPHLIIKLRNLIGRINLYSIDYEVFVHVFYLIINYLGVFLHIFINFWSVSFLTNIIFLNNIQVCIEDLVVTLRRSCRLELRRVRGSWLLIIGLLMRHIKVGSFYFDIFELLIQFMNWSTFLDLLIFTLI